MSGACAYIGAESESPRLLRLIALYPQRGRVEQTIDELLKGHDFDHLVSYRLHPNRVAVGFRLLARNLANRSPTGDR